MSVGIGLASAPAGSRLTAVHGSGRMRTIKSGFLAGVAGVVLLGLAPAAVADATATAAVMALIQSPAVC